MAWNKKENPEEDAKKELYTEADYKRFCEDRGKYTGNKKINGILASSFETYLHELHVITVSEGVNRFTVHDPEGYTKLNAMNTRYELREYHKDQEFMAQNPEARTAFQERIAKLRAKLVRKQ